MRLKSLRARMTAAFALAFAVLILLFSSFVLWFARHAAQSQADAALQTAVETLQSEYGEAQSKGWSFRWNEEADELTHQGLTVRLLDSEKQTVLQTPGKVPNWPHPDAHEWRTHTVSLGDRTAVLGYHWGKIENTLRFQALLLTALSMALFVVATFGAWLLVGRTLSPIHRLSIQADAASLDNLRVHLNTPSRDTEIVHLVGTLNALLGRLSGAISARERFYAAASHELRTPLQTLSGSLELALMRPRSTEDYRAALAEAYAQSERLSALVQALLLLNQLEATPARAKETANLSDICARWTQEFMPLAGSRKLRFAVCLPETVSLAAIPSHLDILLRNLLENAVKYALPESTIQVQILETPAQPTLTIFNRCAEPPAWDENRLFEPFYRPDTARNSETGGNGLGLAICKAITVANGWRLSLSRHEDGVQAKVVFDTVLTRD